MRLLHTAVHIRMTSDAPRKKTSQSFLLLISIGAESRHPNVRRAVTLALLQRRLGPPKKVREIETRLSIIGVEIRFI